MAEHAVRHSGLMMPNWPAFTLQARTRSHCRSAGVLGSRMRCPDLHLGRFALADLGLAIAPAAAPVCYPHSLYQDRGRATSIHRAPPSRLRSNPSWPELATDGPCLSDSGAGRHANAKSAPPRAENSATMRSPGGIWIVCPCQVRPSSLDIQSRWSSTSRSRPVSSKAGRLSVERFSGGAAAQGNQVRPPSRLTDDQ
jgi:hypothetical protein